VVTPRRRTVGQNSWVLNDSTSAKDEPCISADQTGRAPPTWNIGRVIKLRSEPASGLALAVVCICSAEHSTPFEGPVVPEV